MATSEPSPTKTTKPSTNSADKGSAATISRGCRAAIVCVDASKGYWPGSDDTNQMANG
ncbi:hypothetical protein [Streptomyces globisporus]|uniref:hypothetical protein n=1 Tax=Streptomyces globisporus TaxID=1908 RepID=UPI000AE62DD5|nr:hypothetical protein [Streptomyces globisporus]